MSMTDKTPDDSGIEIFFEAARAAPEPASPALMARILADAEAVQAASRKTPAPRRAGLVEYLYRLLGGWPAMAGLATAAVAGLWLGASLPTGLLAANELDYVLDMAPGLAFDLAAEDF
jgi:hypothetical protein